MPEPPVVSKADVLLALRHVRRLGNTAALHALERREPDLTELLLEEAGHVHRRLVRRRLPPPLLRQLTRRVENLGVTLITAQKLAYLRQRQADFLSARPDQLAARHP